MSKEYFGFENEKGDIGFLAGVVDVLSDNLSLICDMFYTLDADIFYVKNGDMSLLNSSVKKRLHYFNQRYYDCKYSEKDIELLDFNLKKIDCDVNIFLHDNMKNYSSSPELSNAVNAFLRDLEWHLGKPSCIYFPVELPDKNINTLARIYLYLAWNYFFISYDEYLVLIILGAVE